MGRRTIKNGTETATQSPEKKNARLSPGASRGIGLIDEAQVRGWGDRARVDFVGRFCGSSRGSETAALFDYSVLNRFGEFIRAMSPVMETTLFQFP
jgi:hypothetical protein